MDFFVESAGDALSVISSQLIPFFECVKSDGVKSCWTQYDSLVVSFWLCIAFAAYCLIWSIVGNNCSKVDQLWSITPVVYSWLFYGHHRAISPSTSHHDRLLLICILITAWGVRLTYNFWRRGGYGNFFVHEEDYRWPVLRKIINNPILFFIFNVTFIASYQNLLLLLIALPVYFVATGPANIDSADEAVACLFLVFLIMETVADQQHWNFQSMKHAIPQEKRATHKDRDVRNGFFQGGLFAYSRHPNYFAEQAMWVCVYLYSVTRIERWEEAINVWVTGCLLLIMLFQGSMAFSESITLSRYPEYRDYQRRVSQCFPWFARPSPADKASVGRPAAAAVAVAADVGKEKAGRKKKST